jgi:hypothetical protein
MNDINNMNGINVTCNEQDKKYMPFEKGMKVIKYRNKEQALKQKEQYLKEREKRSEYQREYYKNNREHLRKYNKKYYKRKKAEKKKYMKTYFRKCYGKYDNLDIIYNIEQNKQIKEDIEKLFEDGNFIFDDNQIDKDKENECENKEHENEQEFLGYFV